MLKEKVIRLQRGLGGQNQIYCNNELCLDLMKGWRWM